MSDLPTLDKFLQTSEHRVSANAYVREPGFKTLYVRRTYHYIGIGLRQTRTIDIASVTAKRTGKSTFKKLIARLRRDYPNDTIYVESVLSERFAEGLLRMGFKSVEGQVNCYYLGIDKDDRMIP